jgi:hypothetical protein
LAGRGERLFPLEETLMYPSSFEPIEHTDYEHPEAIEERRAASSWKTWLIVMLAIAAFALIFMIMGDAGTAPQTTQVVPETPAN